MLNSLKEEKENKEEKLKIKKEKYKKIMEANNQENMSIIQDFERNLDSEFNNEIPLS